MLRVQELWYDWPSGVKYQHGHQLPQLQKMLNQTRHHANRQSRPTIGQPPALTYQHELVERDSATLVLVDFRECLHGLASGPGWLDDFDETNPVILA